LISHAAVKNSRDCSHHAPNDRWFLTAAWLVSRSDKRDTELWP
jgi:hypothetical protein